jgi:acrylyl-CoA reductase (NADPH)
MTNKVTFKAMVVTESEDKQYHRTITRREISELPAGEVLIRVHYSSLNYKDALSATGNKGVTRQYPHTPGIDAAGIVEESSNPSFIAGQKVLVTGYDLGMNTAGGFGEYTRVPASWVVALPEKMPLDKSMMYGTAGFTAALSVYKLINNGVRSEDGPILVTGSTGGVGSVAVSILCKLGFTVLGGSTKNDAEDFLLSLGAAGVVRGEELNDQSGKPMLKPRWAGVVDTVGGNPLSTAIRTTKYGGTVTTCGNVASADFSANVYPFILRGVSLLGIDSVQCPMPFRLKIWDLLSTDWDLPGLEKLVNRISLEDLDPAIDAILAGKSVGRTLVVL